MSIPWEQINRDAARATPEIRALALELSEDSIASAWSEPFDPDDPWLLAALVRAYELSTLKPARTAENLCDQQGCGELATYRYRWPGTGKQMRACTPHAKHACVVVQAMGLDLALEPIG